MNQQKIKRIWNAVTTGLLALVVLLAVGLWGSYFAETIETFPKPADFSAELREAGFTFVQHIPLTLGVANIHIAVRG